MKIIPRTSINSIALGKVPSSEEGILLYRISILANRIEETEKGFGDPRCGIFGKCNICALAGRCTRTDFEEIKMLYSKLRSEYIAKFEKDGQLELFEI